MVSHQDPEDYEICTWQQQQQQQQRHGYHFPNNNNNKERRSSHIYNNNNNSSASLSGNGNGNGKLERTVGSLGISKLCSEYGSGSENGCVPANVEEEEECIKLSKKKKKEGREQQENPWIHYDLDADVFSTGTHTHHGDMDGWCAPYRKRKQMQRQRQRPSKIPRLVSRNRGGDEVAVARGGISWNGECAGWEEEEVEEEEVREDMDLVRAADLDSQPQSSTSKIPRPIINQLGLTSHLHSRPRRHYALVGYYPPSPSPSSSSYHNIPPTTQPSNLEPKICQDLPVTAAIFDAFLSACIRKTGALLAAGKEALGYRTLDLVVVGERGGYLDGDHDDGGDGHGHGEERGGGGEEDEGDDGDDGEIVTKGGGENQQRKQLSWLQSRSSSAVEDIHGNFDWDGKEEEGNENENEDFIRVENWCKHHGGASWQVINR